MSESSIKWYWSTQKKFQYLADRLKEETGLEVIIEKFGSHSYSFSWQGDHGTNISYAYSTKEAMGFLHGLERGLKISSVSSS